MTQATDAAATATYPNVFAPLTVGEVGLGNRVVVTAHVVNFGDNLRHATERHVAYHVERARGGVGLIIMESLAVHPTAGPSTYYLQIWDDSAIEPLRRVTAAVAEHGVPMFAQINHGGREHKSLFTQRPLLAPSPVPSPVRRETPHEMSRREIGEITRAFAAGADRARRAGFAGVEIHSGHGYLLNQFLSPWTNRREDEYGGSLDGRMRFPLEVLAAVHDVVGDDLAVGVRISADEFTEGGLALADMTEVAGRYAETGLLSYLSVSQGNYNSPETFIPDESFGHTPFIHLPREIKRAVGDLPVIAVGAIVTAADAERVLVESGADLVGMTRAHIADPALVRKTLEGREDEICRCILCNQGCLGRLFNLAPIGCTQNPVVGFETEWSGEIEPAAAPKRVVVVGGGPAGMEAAWVAAARGHDVLLFEEKDELGGALRNLIRTGSRLEFEEMIRYRTRMLDLHGVKVRLGEHATATEVLAAAPDAVVVATGASMPRHDEVAGALTVEEIVEAPHRCGDRVIVFDRGEDHEVLAVTQFLVDQGRTVTLATASPAVAAKVVGTTSGPWLRRLVSSGVELVTSVQLDSFDDGAGSLRRALTGEVSRVPADTLVVTGSRRARDDLFRALEDEITDLHVVGDACAPREALEAVLDGHRAARSL